MMINAANRAVVRQLKRKLFSNQLWIFIRNCHTKLTYFVKFSDVGLCDGRTVKEKSQCKHMW